MVIFACKEIQIPYLRLARHEHLNSTGQKHFAVRLTKRTVICGIDLIIYILLSMKIFDHAATRYNQIYKLANIVLRKQTL